MTAPMTGMKKVKTQPDYRKNLLVTDQFGRSWAITVEKDTGDVCGQIFTAGWVDPLRTPQVFFKMVRGADGEPNWRDARVDLRAWYRQQVDEERQWKVNFNNIGYQTFGREFRPEKHMTDPWLLQLVGPRPWPSSDAIKLAIDGHKGLLGKRPMDEEVRQYLEYRYSAASPDEFEIRDTRAHEEFMRHKEKLAQVEGDTAYVPGEVQDITDSVITGTSQQDYVKFIRQAKEAGMSQPEATLAWKAHKEAVSELQAEKEEA